MIKQFIALGLAIVTSSAIQAEVEHLYYWDNQTGLKKADHCQLTTTKQTKFRFSTVNGLSPSVNLKNSEGVDFVELPIGSLLKRSEGKTALKNESFEVVGANQNAELLLGIKITLKNAIKAERGDIGFLNEKNSENIENRVIKITERKLNLRAGTYLKVHGNKEYLKLSCPEFKDREYLVFHIYSRTNERPIAAVGVYWDETSLFTNIKTFNKAVAYQALPVMAEEENIVLSEIKQYASMIKTYTQTETPSGAPKAREVENTPPAPIIENITIQTGLDNIVCTSNSTVNIRNNELNKVLFTAQNGEKLKLFQGWGENKKETVIDGKHYTFIKVELVGREQKDQQTGYIASLFVTAKSECPYQSDKEIDNNPVLDSNSKITGLDDTNCCIFPTLKKVITPFTDGMRRFGSSRGGGTRIHAAVDLYRFKNEPLLSVAPGTVIRDLYFFYQGTYALEVVHSGGFVVRYGEVTGKSPDGIQKGNKLLKGQRLAFMGKVNSGCCEPMLHFELYKGNKKGSLSEDGKSPLDGKRYNRRADLLNPTPYLLKWQNEQFNK